MTSEQLRAALKKLGLMQVEFASLVGLADRTVRNYVHTGVTNVPTAILVTLLTQRKITVDDIRNTRQSPFPSSPKEVDEFYRRFARAPVTFVDRRLR